MKKKIKRMIKCNGTSRKWTSELMGLVRSTQRKENVCWNVMYDHPSEERKKINSILFSRDQMSFATL